MAWDVKNNENKSYFLEKSFKFKNFAESQHFVNEVGKIAEIEDHHPDIMFGWGYAIIKIFTHKINGLVESDFILAILSTFVRLGVVVWAGFIISLNYVEIPGLGEQTPKDITFIASIFTGTLATFGIQPTNDRKGKKDD